MVQELKIRITNIPKVESKLKQLGATFVQEKTFIDTYTNQPAGQVLKIADEDGNYFIYEYRKNDGKFDEVNKETVSDYEKTKKQLIEKYGLKGVLQGKRRIYAFQGYKFVLNHIDEVGDFLIITGENPTADIVTSLGKTPLEYIRVSFDELTKQ